MKEFDLPPAEEEYHEADRELQEIGYACLDRLHEAGAKLDDIQFVGWLAGLADWKPEQRSRH